MIEMIDFYFPFIIFGYGCILILMLEVPPVLSFTKKKLPHYHEQFLKHKSIGFIAFFVGGLWSAQNLFLT